MKRNGANFCAIATVGHPAWADINHQLAHIDWSHPDTTNDLNLAYDTFQQQLCDIIDTTSPLKNCGEKTNKHRKTQPWMTTGLSRSSRKRKRLHRNCIRTTETSLAHMLYLKYKNKFYKLKRKVKLVKQLVKDRNFW